jgi:CubicO group peptidase (beta-lactamase class C family)
MDRTNSATTSEEFASLCEQVEAAMVRHQVPGVAVGLWHQGREYTAGFGVTNVNHPLPVTSDTLFQIGSTTKTVTATAAMRLVERGTLDLDRPVRTYLPTLKLADADVAARVSLRHLFTHTAGWEGDVFDNTGAGDDALARMVERMAQVEQLRPIGSLFSYNNAGYYLAGRVIEAVTGLSYEAAARDLVLEPLGMARSFFFAREVITDRVAVGHSVGELGPTVNREWSLTRASNPVGGLVSTVVDQLRYARFHLGDGSTEDGKRLLAPDSMALMQTPQLQAGSGIESVGVTWLLRTVGGTRIVEHGGSTNGQESAFVLVPAHGFALTVLTNADRGAALHGEITAWALQHILSAGDPEPALLHLPASTLVDYSGRYSAPLWDIEVRPGDDDLIVQITRKAGFPTSDSPPVASPPPMRAGFYGPDRLIVLDGPLKGGRGEFGRHPDGSIGWLHLMLRANRRQNPA